VLLILFGRRSYVLVVLGLLKYDLKFDAAILAHKSVTAIQTHIYVYISVYINNLSTNTDAMTPRSYPKRIDPMEAKTPTRNCSNQYLSALNSQQTHIPGKPWDEEPCFRFLWTIEGFRGGSRTCETPQITFTSG
jgi:hypothetical protein